MKTWFQKWKSSHLASRPKNEDAMALQNYYDALLEERSRWSEIFYQTVDYSFKIRISWMIQGLEFAISNFQKAFPDIVELNEKDGNRE